MINGVEASAPRGPWRPLGSAYGRTKLLFTIPIWTGFNEECIIRGTARILLFEDNDADVSLMKYALDGEKFRYELTTLQDGAEALAFIRREGKYARSARPELIVMDLHLPNSDGIEILSEIRGSTEFADVPVAILSESVSQEEKERVAAFRATCFIAKPRDLDGFLNVGKRLKQLALQGKAR